MKILEFFEKIASDGWLQQGILLEIRGETVQLLRYDKDNDSILVKVGERVSEMSNNEIPDFVRRRLETL